MAESKYIVTLSNLKKNTIEFELEADGISVNNSNVNLVIEAASMCLMFEANQIGTKKWEVEIPPLPMLKRTTYPFKITLASEGYYFEPMLGNVNIVGNESVKVTSIPTNTVTEANDSKKIDRLTASFSGKNPESLMDLNPKRKGKESKSTNDVKVFEAYKTLTNEEPNKKTLKDKKETKPILTEKIINKKSFQDIKEQNKKDELVLMILSEMKNEPEILKERSNKLLKKRGIISH